ncbi:MAG: Nucleoside-diphosphate-sugar epimerase [Parcubacteria group bacterium GW2011_GWD2_40_9]|nr:MAG: Nucleoside-diphosphate-sugar epimerase [Parcubacteria group bacterium GW2011_GWD2_40_9]
METEKKFESLKSKTFLVTGGAGFIGSSMCEKLLNLGSKVLCVDNLSTGKLDNISNFRSNKNFIFIKGDVNKKNILGRIFKKNDIDYVIHYAAVVGVKRTLSDPFSVLNDIEGIKNILELSKLNNVKKAIFASSSEVYGDSDDLPGREDHTPLNARLPYAAVKSIGENYFRVYYEVCGLPTISLRFFNVYGPKQESSSYGFVTAIFMNQIINDKPITIFGDGRQTRDFVYIEDNLNATLMAIINPAANGESINIGTGKETAIIELANKTIEISGKKNRPVFLPARKKGDMLRRCPDVSKMKNILKYYPKYDLNQGLRKTFEFYGYKFS